MNQPQGNLPSNTENNPRREDNEHCKAITLRSGKELPEVVKPQDQSKEMVIKDEKDNVVQPQEIVTVKVKASKAKGKSGNVVKDVRAEKFVSPLPYPQRGKNKNLERQYKKFLEVLKQLHINIRFVEALEQMPSYAKFMKNVLSRKRRLGEFETVALTQECSAILQRRLPTKMQDPGSFVISRNIGKNFAGKALCDLGASVNFMPLSIFRKLGLRETRPTTVTLQLADRSICYPNGVIEDVLVKVDKLIFPADFIVLDFEEDKDIPIILDFESLDMSARASSPLKPSIEVPSILELKTSRHENSDDSGVDEGSKMET